MSTALEEKLSYILQEKTNKIIPENIKKGVQIFDVLGTLEVGNKEVKLFETQEEMQSDPSAAEDDLAIVYRNEITNMKADTQTQFITFPETVILPEAFVGDAYVDIQAVDGSGMASGNVMLQSDAFRFDWFGRNGMVRISYTSSDGITFTRDNFQGDEGELTNLVDLGSIVKCSMPEDWNEAFGYFMQTGGSAFEGLYKCDKIKVENDVVKFVPLSSLTITVSDFNVNFSWDGTSVGDYNTAKMREMTQKISTELSKIGFYAMSYFIDTDDDLCVAFTKKSLGQSSTLLLYKNNNTPHWGVNINPAEQVDVYKVNLDEMSYSLKSTLDQTGSISAASTYHIYNIKSKTLPVNIPLGSSYHSISTYWVCSTESASTSTGYKVGYYTPEGYETSHDEFRYFIAPSQLTATSENIYNAMAYGENGIMEGTLTTSPSNSFVDTNAEVYYKLQQAYENMEPRVLTEDDKTIDKNLYFILINKSGEPLLDLSQLEDAHYLFSNCANLTNIPSINTSNITNMNAMFSHCTNLLKVAEIDTSNATKMSETFFDCPKLTQVPTMNTSKVTDVSSMFQGCQAITKIPEMDTSNVENMGRMFLNCTNLVEVPVLNASKVSRSDGMELMFSGCLKLSDESLNNILQMCISATNRPSDRKTLKSISLTQEQATKCTTLENYEAFTAAGWTTGY